MNSKKYLLPAGFYDLLGDEAKINHKAVNLLLDKFENFGYDLVKTPLVEFEETYESALNSFKMVDILSGKNLALRNDITTQITRLVATKLEIKNTPLRICYVGDVLKMKNEDLLEDRQLTQAGIEIIGSNSIDASKEITDVVLQGLANINLPNLLIDLCIPQFADLLLEDLGLNKDSQLRLAIEEKNISSIKKFGDKYADDLIGLVLKIGDLKDVKDILSNLVISDNVQNKLDDLEKIIQNIKNNYPEISVVVDIFGDKDFSYHKDIAFTIFEDGFNYPIARGGRYTIASPALEAVGATIYINNLRKILVKMPIENKSRILVKNDSSIKDITNLQEKGYVTIKSLRNENCDKNNLIKEAKENGCLLIWNDKIVKF